MKRPSAQFIRRFFYTLLLLFTVALTTLAIFISQLDLDDYRHELEQELSTILDQPVKIGTSSLTYRHGIALELTDLQIGLAAAPLAEVPHLTATLKLKPLLDGRFVLDQVQIDQPKLQFWIPVIQRPESGTTHELMDALGIRILTINDAELHLHQRLTEGARQLLHLNNLYLVLTDWEKGKAGRVVINGHYQQQHKPAEFTLDLSLPTSADPTTWRDENFRYRLRLQNIATAGLPKPTGVKLPESVDLSASLSGTPATGASLEAKLTSHVERKQLLEVKGTWQSTPEQELLSQLSGSLLGLPIKGQLQMQHQEQKQLLSGRIDSEPIALTPQLLARWYIPQAAKLPTSVHWPR